MGPFIEPDVQVKVYLFGSEGPLIKGLFEVNEARPIKSQGLEE